MNSFLSEQEIKSIGLKSCGNNVHISRKASFYGADNISIGDNVRIDDFCILSGNITLGRNIHIAAYTALYGSDVGIFIDDFANISSRICIYAVSDDFSGNTLSSPTIPEKYKNLTKKEVIIERHAIIGTGCTILPGAIIREGTALGAMSLCKSSTEPWTIYAGIPAKVIRRRSKELLNLEHKYLTDNT